MSATLDTNVLVYASNTADPLHIPAAKLVARLAAGPELLYLSGQHCSGTSGSSPIRECWRAR